MVSEHGIMDRNTLAELLEALDSRRDAEERRKEERYSALIEPVPCGTPRRFRLRRLQPHLIRGQHHIGQGALYYYFLSSLDSWGCSLQDQALSSAEDGSLVGDLFSIQVWATAHFSKSSPLLPLLSH
ncbi:UNVERIFIED_CONTAM: hypothetical protein FKN15_032214 [Acipenser sinensis]